MGEAKNKRDRRTAAEQAALELTHKLMNDGKLIEGGFAAMCMFFKLEPDDPHVPALRFAWMAGAEHLFSSIMGVLDEGDDPTPADYERMDKIGNELEAWRERATAAGAEAWPVKGSA